MLYTVVPLERIYTNRTRSILDDYRIKSDHAPNETVEYKELPIANGKISIRQEGSKNIIDRIHSTDMSDYLNVKYLPGMEIDIK
ncbi:MAG TPA: hypothetical protein GX705_05235 [Clostridiales bacterium]|nr:hypothetical protein [Clostridiales bacterium]